MQDSMYILGELRRRGYEPQDHARPSEGWFDLDTDDSTLRVIVTGDEVRFCAFDACMVLVWDARFPDGCPAPVILAALDAAEADADGEWWTTQERLDHERHQHAQHAKPCRLCVADARRATV